MFNPEWLKLVILFGHIIHISIWKGVETLLPLKAFYEGNLDEEQIVIHKGSGGR